MTTDNRANEPKQTKAKSSRDFVLPSVEQVAEVLAASYDPEYGIVDDIDRHAAGAVRALFGEVAGDE